GRPPQQKLRPFVAEDENWLCSVIFRDGRASRWSIARRSGRRRIPTRQRTSRLQGPRPAGGSWNRRLTHFPPTDRRFRPICESSADLNPGRLGSALCSTPRPPLLQCHHWIPGTGNQHHNGVFGRSARPCAAPSGPRGVRRAARSRLALVVGRLWPVSGSKKRTLTRLSTTDR